MKLFKKHKKIKLSLLVIFTVLLLIVAWLSLAWPRGALVACFDYFRGNYEVKTYGLPASWRWDYAKLLKKRYGVTLKAEAGCVVTLWLVGYIDGYNYVSKSFLQKKYNKDIFEECRVEAKKKLEKHDAKIMKNKRDWPDAEIYK